MRTAKRAAAIFATIAIVCGLSQLGAALTVNENGTPDTNVQKIQAELTKSLDKVQFKSVKVAVNSGIVTLTGVVDLYAYKADAAKRAHHIYPSEAHTFPMRNFNRNWYGSWNMIAWGTGRRHSTRSA
jgi:osmotically-inducible protein OsmY